MEQKEEAGKKRSGVWRIFHRNGAERRLAQEIGNGEQVTVSQVSSITSGLEDKWKESNSKVRIHHNLPWWDVEWKNKRLPTDEPNRRQQTS